MHRRFFVGMFILLTGVLSACGGLVSAPGGKVEIIRDQYGTPHVFAKDNDGVYFGYGYAVATDRMYQMEILKRTVEGRVAEVLGAEFTSLDIHIRTGYDFRSVRRQIAQLPPDQQTLLQAYADGFNFRIQEVLRDSKLMPVEFSVNDFVPEAWTLFDVAMIFVGSIAHRYSDFNSELDNLQLLQHLIIRHGKDKAWSIFNASRWLLDKDSPTTVSGAPAQLSVEQQAIEKYSSLLQALPPAPATKRVAIDLRGVFSGTTEHSEVAKTFRQHLHDQGFTFSPEFAPASNFWALNHIRLQNHRGILVNGPQFGWGLPSYVYGIGLHGGDFHVVGNTLLGLPALLFAHNNHVGWGSTAGLSDQVDVYIETLNPENPEQYLHQGVYRNFDSWQESIKVKQGDMRVVTARRTVHGMVLQMDTDNQVAYSRARAWEGGELATLMTWINLAKDQTLDAVQKRLAGIATNINFYYMDRQGNLGYTHGGLYPQRVEGHDPRLPTTGTGSNDWQGFLPYADSPTARNPLSGYLVNWNNRPRSDWISSDLWTQTWSRADRVSLLIKELESARDMSVENVWAINQKVSYRDISAPFILPRLQQAIAEASLSETEKQAWQQLIEWDQQWLADQTEPTPQYGPAPAMMETWLSLLLERVFKDDIGEAFFYLYAATNNPNRKLGASMATAPGTKILIRNLDRLAAGEPPDYDFFNGVPPAQVLRASFSDAVQKLAENQGTDVTRWSIGAHPMQWRPYNFRGVPQTLTDRVVAAPAYMNRGSENNLFIADAGGFTAFDVIPPGQSGHLDAGNKAHKNYSDQMELFLQYGYKPVPFSRKEVEGLATSRRVIDVDAARKLMARR